LVDKGIVKTPADVYQLELDELADLDRMGQESAQNLLDAIKASKNKPLARFIYALGVPGVGEEVAKVLVDYFKTLDALIEADWKQIADEKKEIQKENLKRIKRGEPPLPLILKGVGPELMDSISKFFREKHNLDVIRQLTHPETGIHLEFISPSRSKGPLSGKTFVFTGTLPNLTREEAERCTEAQGGRVSDSVSKKTDYVVVGTNPGGTLEKARKLGIRVIDEQEWTSMLKARSRHA